LAVLELGAGTAIATIRALGERLASERDRTTLVRVNPDATDAEEPVVVIKAGALEALRSIEDQLPAAFKVAARAGVPIARPTSGALPMGPGAGFEPVPARDLDLLEFDEAPRSAPRAPAWWSAAASPTDLRSVSLIDLASGQVEPFNYIGISAADHRACAECWYGRAQQEFAPLPEVGGYVESGFRLRGGVIKSADAAEGERPGAALMFICGPEGEAVLTVGVARQPSDAAFVWRYLYERADVRPKPLEHPRAPWVAQRVELGAEKHAAMLPVLREVSRMLAWTWLRVQAYRDQHGDGE
jgi:hypothetical protein